MEMDIRLMPASQPGKIIEGVVDLRFASHIESPYNGHASRMSGLLAPCRNRQAGLEPAFLFFIGDT